MKLLVASALLLIGSQSFAAAPLLNGEYACNDGGTLELQYKASRDMYYASLSYEDGSSSVLDLIGFDGTSSDGIMYPDDEGTIGVATPNGGTGTSVTLKFNGGDQVVCKHKTMSRIVEE